MKKFIFTLLLVLFTFNAFSQQAISVINTGIYTSYFSNSLHEPIYVTYKLWRAGGDCDRSGFHFLNDTKLSCATPADYSHSGYDEGHLADAKDFAGDCKKEEVTFRFYNCVPQTPNLNRGIWKEYETTARKLSQTDSLFIICGSYFGNKTIGKGAAVPDYCWKIIESLSTKKVLYCLWFTNTNSATVVNLTVEQLESKLGHKIILK